ncbi:epoxide hydrolase family protein [Phreatobacter stygius]|uniref:Epoxide hydrolase n=1 Tax=Phreatobacter stygius TaxID=1940610 RepID=A0A4D7BBG6_9HYPH|nr:epoxide hydrolase family protein [Phreatobacter stygius]QCI67448.1 epoxide hydrolase [Phreatobacter stygius]
MSITPATFTLRISDRAVEDLKERLARTRWPDRQPDRFDDGDADGLGRLVAYWRDDFDWRSAEARLNAFPQFKVPIGGVDLHYLHVPGRGPDPTPLILCHGWPGSVFEFLGLIPRLTDPARFGGDPADAFTVIAPSLPGYGLSYAPGQPCFSANETAGLLMRLMTEVLGYQGFAAHGVGWGAAVTARLGHVQPDPRVAMHLSLLSGLAGARPSGTPPVEQKTCLAETGEWQSQGRAYAFVRVPPPPTSVGGPGFEPADPATDPAAGIAGACPALPDGEAAVTPDDLLANISLYWFTGAIKASFWPHYTHHHGAPVPGAAGEARPAKENARPQPAVARAVGDAGHWTVIERGGHFAPMAQPKALAGDLREFFRPLRS